MTNKLLLTAGIIGLGVGERHIDGYEADPRCRVKTICDIDPDKLKDVSTRYPGRNLVTDPLDVLDDPEIDVVSIASYDDAHYKQIVRALTNKKHVFVEKPMCLFRDELDDIAAHLNADPSLHLSSNLILRKSPRFIDLKKTIEQGDFGDVYYVEADYNYGRVEKILTGWRAHQEYHSVIHGGGIHMIDLLLWLTNKPIVEVTAFGNNIATRDRGFKRNDLIAALLRFEDGSIGKVTANYACVFPHYHNLSIYGMDKTFIQNHNGGASLYTSRDPGVEPTSIDSSYPGAVKGDMIPAFIRSILDGTEQDVSAQEVFDAMNVSLAIEESLLSGKTTPIPLYKIIR
ncbi:MAG: Gfo/Idh/MocA family oxidoreductase [Phycisphaeraceae bacterium]|nr:Gfo/Idh/MocA family oxidoreductase [Phycisphaeraceae bacterium]